MKSANKRETLEAMASGWRLWRGCFGFYLTPPKDGPKRDVRLNSGDALLREKLIRRKPPLPEWLGEGEGWEVNQ